MTLHFMQQWPDGTPTYFVEKVLKSIYPNRIDLLQPMAKYFSSICKPDNFDYIEELKPKHHTIRFLTDERAAQWQAEGRIINFKIWTGKPYKSKTFEFAQAPVVSLQRVYFTFPRQSSTAEWGCIQLEKDGFMLKYDPVKELAINDGFESFGKFFEYFNESLVESYAKKGKHPYIIHWTGLGY